jgi:hyperosmotically inducible protein
MKRTLFSALCVAVVMSGPAAGRAVASQGTEAKAGSSAEDRIEHRIHDDAMLKKHDIKVSVSGDVVTLTGKVATTAERNRAARLAHVKGIARVDNQIAVDSAARATSGTLERAAEKTKEGTLKAIDKTKEGAEKAADKTKEGSVKAVEKTGQGVRKAGSELADAFVLASVKSRLFGEDVLKGSDINVDCDAHVVTLKGTVQSEAARARAIELARKTDGVDRVVDHLTVGPKK